MLRSALTIAVTAVALTVVSGAAGAAPVSQLPETVTNAASGVTPAYYYYHRYYYRPHYYRPHYYHRRYY